MDDFTVAGGRFPGEDETGVGLETVTDDWPAPTAAGA